MRCLRVAAKAFILVLVLATQVPTQAQVPTPAQMPTLAHAQESVLEPEGLLLIEPQSGSLEDTRALDAAPAAELEIAIAPDQWGKDPAAISEMGDLKKEFENRSTEQAAEKFESELVIPDAPTNPSLLATLAQLTREQRQEDLARKRWALSALGHSLRFLKMTYAKTNELLMFMNDQLLEASEVMRRSNVNGQRIPLNGFLFKLTAGLAPPDLLVERLRQTKIGALLPKRVGFFYALSFGGAFQTIVENGRSRLHLELFTDVHRLKSVQTYIAVFRLQAGASLIYEAREKAKDLSRQALVYAGFPAGVSMLHGSDHFSVNILTGVTVPPFIQAGSMYEEGVTRYRWLSVDIRKTLLPKILEFFGIHFRQDSPRPSGALSCSRVLMAN